ADTTAPLPPTQRERQEVAHRNAMRLLRLVNSLLDFSRIEAGRVDAVYEPVDLAALTADLASVFRSAVERAGLKLIVDCATLGRPVHVDRDMWEKIVLNLLSNAFKFTFEGGITVALRPAEERVELLVRDTGTGIAAEELPHIFERFHRVRSAHGRTHEGTGIGLALVQELVKLHGGTVRVTSELNRGATFTVAIPFGTAHLPADRIGATRTLTSTALGAAPYVEEALRWLPDEIAADVAAFSAAPVSTQGARVLLADDNADMRDYVRRLLSQHWTVEAVGDGQAALEAARARRLDLVLTDVMMPRLDGFALLRALRAEAGTRSIPVILVSARAGEESRVEGLDAGADDYLVKPFSARELLARVNAHLELARVRREMMDRERAARMQAEQANRAKDEFLAVLSHELRTPLNSILGWAVLLKGGPTDGPSLSRGLEVIERNARAQSQLIEDLLDVSRIITGKLRLDVRPVDLVAVVNAAIDAVRPAATAKEIRLQSILDPKAGPIAGDPDRLQQVMWNLLSNAVKFTSNRGRVQVRLERINSHVEVVVSDTGCGIGEDVLPYVFDRFRQADSTSSRRHGGLGLGLALVKHLVELHGGAVRAESAGVDRGATFVVKLPLMAQLAPEATAREHPTTRRVESPVEFSAISGLRLLIVDDEPETLELFTRLFRQHGAEVVAAKSAAEALDQLAAGLPDVLICDIEMPGEDGYSLIRKVRALGLKEGGSVPAVAVTAYGSVDDRIRLLAAGFQMHVPKPVEPAELVTVVASVAGRTPRST
ncbi:MAG: ATP-binding protein, partial [Candidatus Rokuibacteriota bacterium]